VKKNSNNKIFFAFIFFVAMMSLVLAGCSSSAASTTNTTKPLSTTVSSGDTNISAIPSADTVKPGDKFDVSIRVTNSQPSRGVQFSLSWDPSKIQCDSVEQGDYFSRFAQANNGDLFIIPSANPPADNTAGIFPKPSGSNTYVAIAMTGAWASDNTELGVTGSGNIYILHMSVKAGASGTANLTLGNIKVVDIAGKDLGAVAKNSKVTISQ